MPDRREHWLFRRFGAAIAKPGILVLRSSEKLGSIETSERVGEEAPVRRQHIKTEAKSVSGRLKNVRDPKHHPDVIPGQGRADMLFDRDRGASSKN